MGELVWAAQRDRAITRAKAALDGAGADLCRDCGRDIPAARRVALPSAIRCVTCQSIHEGSGATHHA
ncbi:TraR/DksA C4-type zinc finger protein [Novosphingobium sp.]|uniref:TraR/DksA C4-type zinc finger protein n=1 Tax=Novosphingobium sp. TaxID=1874826 RepID=UPI0037041764